MLFQAMAYKAGMIDSVVTNFDADNEGTGGNAKVKPPIGAPQVVQPQTMVTTTIFSVWDGDWALLEEYDSTGARVQGYVEGYHGLVKTLVNSVYYYQDELGSTSHVADTHGVLLEYYKYDLYGKPTYFSPNNPNQPLTASTFGVKDLFTGQRWIVEIGLYDDRNRFMSPDLGRFLQPDPIGFKGDGSNLYRYCGNDWANRSDPMGTQDVDTQKKLQTQNYRWDAQQKEEQTELRFEAYAPTANSVARAGGNRTYSIAGGRTLSVQTSSWSHGVSVSIGTVNTTKQSSKQQSLKFTTLSPSKNPWIIRWGLMHNSPNGGIIVQHVVADFKGLGEYNFWEAWHVNPNSRFTTGLGIYGYDDMFEAPPGSHVTTSARFYEGLQLPSSFKGDSVGPAGNLEATTINPRLPTAGATAANVRSWDAE